MLRFLNLLLLVVGIVVAVAGLAMSRRSSGFLVVAVAGAGMLAIALLSDHWRAKHAAERRQRNTEQRIAALTATAWQPGQRLVVPGSAWGFIGSLVLVVASALMITIGLASDTTQYQLAFLGMVLLPTMFISLSRSAAELFKPALQLSVQGVVTPVHGRIPWSEITGIELRKHSHRGFVFHWLHFRVEQYRKVVREPHYTERLLGMVRLGAARRGLITVPLRNKDEQPETVYAVARFLWKQVANSDYQWSPLLSEAANAAARKVEPMLAEYGDLQQMHRRIATEPQKVLDEIKQMGKDAAVIRAEVRRQSRQAKWITAFAVILLLLSLAWQWLKRN